MFLLLGAGHVRYSQLKADCQLESEPVQLMCHWLEISNTILSGWCSGLSGFEVSTRFTSPLYLAPVEPTSRSRISSTYHRTSFPKRHEQPQAPCLDDNHGMKFDNTWNQGVWFALRSATGRPSPQPFSVEDLPAQGEECRRIMKITSAVYTSKKTLSKGGSQARSY